MKRISWLFCLLTTLLSSCIQQEVGGIQINGTLTDQQGFNDNRRMCQLISQTLQHDSKALAELIAFDCGGAGGCYDLGDVITQIICTMGEPTFIQMTVHFSRQQKQELQGLIEVGLEYGDYSVRERRINSVEAQFPDLYRQLQK